jgi:hypothetical protein
VKDKTKRTRGGITEARFILLDDGDKEEILGGTGEKPDKVDAKN